MSKEKSSNPSPRPSGEVRNNPGRGKGEVKGQVPTMQNPPPPPKKESK